MPSRHKTLYRLAEDRVPGYRFGGVFGLLLLTLVYVESAPPTGRWVPLLTIVLVGVTLLAAVVASRCGPVVFYSAAALSLAGILGSIFALLGGAGDERIVAYAVTAFLVLVAPIVIALGVRDRGKIDSRTIFAALSIYVLLGMLWAFVEILVQAASSQHFFAQIPKGTPPDFLYFSFVTLTTVGYGDLTAAGGFGRSLAVLSDARSVLPRDGSGGACHELQTRPSAHCSARVTSPRTTTVRLALQQRPAFASRKHEISIVQKVPTSGCR